MKRILRLQLLMLIVCVVGATLSAFAQNRTISGKVTSADNPEGMPGVNVIIQGTTIGTTTDAEGNYKIEVGPGDNVLVYTFVGYETQQVSSGGRDVINVTLELSTKELTEVIVVGYSEKTKQEITGAVVNVSADKLKGVTGSNLEYQLQGKVAGLQVGTSTGAPGAAAEIRIRGNSSISADGQPLIVVDGIMGGNYNPNDVASITVLKDAAAVALYGSRANAGVIIVTTKRGTSKTPEFTYSTRIGTRNVTTGKFKMMDSQQLYNTERLMFNSSATFNSFRPQSVLNTNTDWVGLAYKQAVVQNHNVSARGKSDKVGYYVAGDYWDEQGTLMTTGYKRYSFRTNLDIDVTKSIKLQTNFNVVRDNTNSYQWRWPYQPFLYLPYDTPFDADGNQRYIDATTPGFLTRDKNNIFHSAQYNDYTGKSTSMNGDVILTAHITPWLTFQSRNRLSLYSYRGDNYEDARTIEGIVSPTVKGILSFSTSEAFSGITTNLLRASRDIGKHQIGGFVGVEASENHSVSGGAAGYGIISGIHVPLGVASPQKITGTENKSAALSFLSEVNYNYDEKYFLTVALRHDGSSIFGADKRWGTFGALSGSWVVSREDFFLPAQKAISFLKLRGGYGIVGNDKIETFQYLATYYFGTQYNGSSAGYPNSLANPNLGWEQTKSSNIGIDLTILNAIDVTIDAFHKDTDRLLFDVPLPPSQGIDAIFKNSGRIVTKGIELGVSGDIISKGDFRWNVGFNIASAQNRVKSLADGLTQLVKTYDGTKQVIRVGEDVNSWYLPKWAGVNPSNGDPQWETLNADGTGYVVTNNYTNASAPQSLQIVGTATPKFFGGLNTSVSWKWLTLSVASAYTYGNMIYHRTREFVDSDGANFNFNMMQLADGWSRWQNPGDVATHPKPVYGGNLLSSKPSSRYLEDGSYWRIRNVMLTFDLPTSFVTKLKMSRASVFISGDNLFTFTKFSGMDPDASLYTSPSNGSMTGMSDFRYPLSKQYLAGLSVSF